MEGIVRRVVIVATFLAVINAQLWTQTNGNPQRTNNLPGSNRPTLACQPTADWIRNDMNSGYLLGSYHGQPVVGNSDSLYYIRHQLYMRSLGIENDFVNWETPGNNYLSPPTLSDDAKTIFSFVNRSFVQSFSAGNGQSMNAAFVPTGMIFSPLGMPNLIYQNSTLYLVYYQFMASALILQFSTSPLKFNWNISGQFNSVALGHDGTIYAATGLNTTNILAINKTGATINTSPLIQDGIGSILVRPDGYLLSSGANTYILTPQLTVTKTLLKYTALAVFSDSSFLASLGSSVTKFTSQGEQDWIYENTDFGTVSSASIDGDSIVYISFTSLSSQFYVVAINASSGDILWDIGITDSDGVSDIDTPVIVGDGTLLVRIGPNIHRLTSCSSNGECSGDICACNSDWFSSNCSVYCNVTQCEGEGNGHRYCSDDGCQCQPDYFPPFSCDVYCNVTECTQNTNNNGYCSENGCSCKQSYFGENCENVCDKGVVSNETCLCYSHYFGEFCSVYCDPTLTCNGHGSCNDNGICVCDTGYKGDSCEAGVDHKKTGLIVGLTCAGIAVALVVGAIVYVRRRNRHRGYQEIKQ